MSFAGFIADQIDAGARTVIKRLPAKKRLVSYGALLSPGLRTRPYYRLMSALNRYSEVTRDDMIVTNMGISAHYRCSIPANKPNVLFGKPEQYVAERSTLLLSSILLRYSDAFLDVGAHVGYYTFYLRHVVPEPKPIHFFEPNVEYFKITSDNVQRNALPAVYGHPEAMGAVDGTTTFYLNLSDPCSSSLTTAFEGKHQVTPVEAPVIRYSTFVEKHGLTNVCAKVDVEGAEAEFLSGADGAVGTLKFLIIELLDSALESNILSALIGVHGLTGYYINDYVLEHYQGGSITYTDPYFNWLFCRYSPEQLSTLVEPYGFQVRTQKGAAI